MKAKAFLFLFSLLHFHLSNAQAWNGRFRTNSVFKEIMTSDGYFLGLLLRVDSNLHEALKFSSFTVFEAKESTKSHREIRKLIKELTKKNYLNYQKKIENRDTELWLLEQKQRICDAILIISEKHIIKLLKFNINHPDYVVNSRLMEEFFRKL